MNDEPEQKTCTNCFYHEYDENNEIVCYYNGETVSEDFTCPEHKPEVTV